MRWLELSVEADAEAVEAVSEILGRVSAGTAVRPTRLIRDPDDELVAREDPDSPFVVSAHVADEPGCSASVEDTARALWHFQAFGLGRVGSLRVRSVDDVDWADAWRRHYVPQRIGRVVVVPSWADEPIGDDEVAVVMDPGMAFGTGLHPTTRGCLAMLQEVTVAPVVLDVGCGSGILGLAALRLGSERVVALDTDQQAVHVTAENAARNGVADRVTVSRGTLGPGPGERYGLVLANLVAAALIDLAPRFAHHLAPAGMLIAGGIIEPRATEVVAAMAAAGLAVAARRDDGEWVTLRLQHAPVP
ncbi:MAG: 50S ribosomal protein L11 methyltransferase [Chloroflexi bacterium]|nr:50S ribosomal protein L11 methyltransferase [Chloroflexota bacterium]